MKIASEASQYLDLINQTGLNIGGTLGSANSLQGAYKAASREYRFVGRTNWRDAGCSVRNKPDS